MMSPRTCLALTILWVALALGCGPAAAAKAAVGAKQFPAGYFFRLHKAPLAEKKRVLAQLDATLQKLNQEGLGLIVKGAVIEKPDPRQETYPQLTILDESGLLIRARKVPNLYYGYQGPGPLNPNIYIVIKKARVDVPESYIRYSLVVEGDFVAYADKFVHAILEGLEGAAGRGQAPEAGKLSK
jgi:hypothetical protein